MLRAKNLASSCTDDRVTVTGELNPANSSVSTYFIATKDRKLWKQEILSGNRNMSMVRVE